MSRHLPQPDPAGNCTTCRRPTADYGHGPQHRRGRVAGHSPFRTPTRAELSRLSIEECAALGYCECGQRLDQHTELPKPKPLSSWMAERSRRLSPAHLDRLMASRTAAMRAFGTEPIAPRSAA